VWHVKDRTLSVAIEIFGQLLTPWRLPLLFLISGAATWHALGTRTAVAYARDRFLWLMVPLAFGMLVIVPPQVYVERLSHGMHRQRIIGVLATPVGVFLPALPIVAIHVALRGRFPAAGRRPMARAPRRPRLREPSSRSPWPRPPMGGRPRAAVLHLAPDRDRRGRVPSSGPRRSVRSGRSSASCHSS